MEAAAATAPPPDVLADNDSAAACAAAKAIAVAASLVGAVAAVEDCTFNCDTLVEDEEAAGEELF